MPATASAPCFSVLSSALLLSQLTGLQSSARRRGGGGGGLAAPAVALGQGWILLEKVNTACFCL